MNEAVAKTSVIGVLAALINFSDPSMFGAAVTGALVYYVLFADRGKWTNIVLFLVSIPMALHISPLVAKAMHFDNQSGVALFSGAVGLLLIEKAAAWIKNPAAFVKTLREARFVFGKEPLIEIKTTTDKDGNKERDITIGGGGE
jgi:hypothetical protein